MIDQERLVGIISDICFYLGEYVRISSGSEPDLDDKKTYYAVSMILFTVLNCLIELGEELVAGLDAGIPSTYRDVFRLLRKADVISSEMEKELSSLVYYRNRLSHQYVNFDTGDLQAVIVRMPVIKEFVLLSKEMMKK